MCPVFSRLKKGISSVLHWCLTGVSLVSQREVNGKWMDGGGVFLFDFILKREGYINESPVGYRGKYALILKRKSRTLRVRPFVDKVKS